MRILKTPVSEFLSKVVFLMIIIMPIMRYYNLWGINTGFEATLKVITLIFLILILLIPNRNIYYIPAVQKSANKYLMFAIYAILVSLLSSGEQTLNFKVIFIFSALIISLLLYSKVDFYSVFHIYSFFVWLMIIICILQWILLLSGHRVPFNLPGLEYTDSWKQLESQIFGMNEYPTALFSEKAHFCEYIVPYIAFCLFSEDFVRNHRIQKAVIVSIMAIMSVSGNGIILVFLCWALYFTVFNSYNAKNKVLLLAVGIGIIILSYILLTQIDTVNTMLSMLFTNNQYGYSKANYRVYRGFDMFSRLPILQKFVGVGYYNMESFAEAHNIISKLDTTWNIYEYFSAFTQLLLYFGIIGFILFFAHIVPLFKKQSNLTKGLIIIFVAITLSSEILFQGFHMMYLLLVLLSIQINEENKKYIDNSDI